MNYEGQGWHFAALRLAGHWAGIAFDRPNGRLCGADGTETPSFA
jgi:hypothetical protein